MNPYDFLSETWALVFPTTQAHVHVGVCVQRACVCVISLSVGKVVKLSQQKYARVLKFVIVTWVP